MCPRAVVSTIREEHAAPSLVAPRLSLPSRRRTLILVVAAVLALAGVALAARLVFHLGAIGIEIVDGPATSLPSNVVTDADLGREVSLAEATRVAGFTPAFPDALGPPDRLWVDETEIDLESGEVAKRTAAAWEPTRELPAIVGTNTGALLMQFEGEWEVAAKQVFAETDRYGDAIVEGRPAFWTTGRAHADPGERPRVTPCTGDRQRPDLAGRRVHVPTRDHAASGGGDRPRRNGDAVDRSGVSRRLRRAAPCRLAASPARSRAGSTRPPCASSTVTLPSCTSFSSD